jgi:long-chain acyl-CoA synthetase
LTETGGAFSVNQLDDFRIGSVGRPFPGHAVRIAADGEVLVRGPCLFRQYHNNPSATAEAIDADGWFHTGDVGTLDADGFLRIVDRKKELIVTAGGKKVAPQLVEGLLKEDPLVSQACVYGDRKPYLVALLTLDWPAVARWAEQRHAATTDFNAQAMVGSAELRADLDAHVARVNVRLARFEQVKRYDVLADDFTVDNGLLTPTLKVRRKAVNARYHMQFEALYHPAAANAVTPSLSEDEHVSVGGVPSANPI